MQRTLEAEFRGRPTRTENLLVLKRLLCHLRTHKGLEHSANRARARALRVHLESSRCSRHVRAVRGVRRARTSFSSGRHPADQQIDVPIHGKYNATNHMKLQLANHIITSVGWVARRPVPWMDVRERDRAIPAAVQ